MTAPRRLVLFVEGEGDEEAAPVLVKRLLSQYNPWAYLVPDPKPFRIRGIEKLVRKNAEDWIGKLQAAAKTRKPLGGVLVLLDGDADRFQGKTFCARDAALYLSAMAREAGAGTLFSVASVFACCEYESWLIAGVESLAGKLLPDGRECIKPGTTAPAGNLEAAPRGAAEWLGKQMVAGYKKTTDQAHLTAMVDLELVRQRNLRSFRRLETAIRQLVTAIASGSHVVTPSTPPAEVAEKE